MKKYFLLFFLILINYLSFAGDKEIFNAMETEIQRAMKNLKIEGMESPYFISLRLNDINYRSYYFAFGSLVEELNLPSRDVEALVRVNNPNLDNSNFSEGWNGESWNIIKYNLPFEDDITALRQIFWIAIDEAYKNSLSTLSKKKGYLQKHPQEEYPQDFLPIQEKTEIIIDQEKILNTDVLKNYAEKISVFLKNYSFLTQGNVAATMNQSIKYYYDSEGNRHKRADQYFIIKVDLEAYTKDWYLITQNLSWASRKIENLPSLDRILSDVKNTLNYMQRILEEKPLEDYTGPVVFMDEASGKFFFDLLGKGISKAREPLSEEEDFFAFLKGNKGFLARRINQKILPSNFEVWDKPNEKEFEGNDLLGFMPVDDEGVKAKDIQIVKDGKLISLPMRRTAIKKFSEVNGHARSIFGELPEAFITNLFINDKEGLSEEEFFNKIKEIASEEGIEEILIINRLKKSEINYPGDMLDMLSSMEEDSLLSNPEMMFLYNIKTGEKKPVWGLEFSKVNENCLKNIIASSENKNIYQSYSSSYFGDPPVSIVSPDIIVEQLNLIKTKKQMLKPSLLAPPDFKK